MIKVNQVVSKKLQPDKMMKQNKTNYLLKNAKNFVGLY